MRCLDCCHRVINTTFNMNWHWSLDKTRALIALAWFIIGGICGFFMGKAVYNQPIDTDIKRDTVIVHDTIPDYHPVPKDSARIKWVTRWLPSKPDTITQWETIIEHDSVAVQVPITSKHYGNEQYDAYVSGFEPNLDSIFVYQKTEYITETITRMKSLNKVSLYLDAGVDYTFNDKQWYPHAGGELVFNNHKRIQFAVEGGVMKTPLASRVNPYAGGKVKIKLF